MRTLLLCLLMMVAKASWAVRPAGRVNGVNIGVLRLDRISANTSKPRAEP